MNRLSKCSLDSLHKMLMQSGYSVLGFVVHSRKASTRHGLKAAKGRPLGHATLLLGVETQAAPFRGSAFWSCVSSCKVSEPRYCVKNGLVGGRNHDLGHAAVNPSVGPQGLGVSGVIFQGLQFML